MSAALAAMFMFCIIPLRQMMSLCSFIAPTMVSVTGCSLLFVTMATGCHSHALIWGIFMPFCTVTPGNMVFSVSVLVCNLGSGLCWSPICCVSWPPNYLCVTSTSGASLDAGTINHKVKKINKNKTNKPLAHIACVDLSQHCHYWDIIGLSHSKDWSKKQMQN